MPGGRRTRPVAAALLLAGLTGAWLVAGHASAAGRRVDPGLGAQIAGPPLAPTSPTTQKSAGRTAASTSTLPVPVRPGCGPLSADHSEVRCLIDTIDIDVKLLARAAVLDAYRRATGADIAPRSGPPACARGVPDERAWSTGSAPTAVAGRYLCRVENGRAAMWWTRSDRLVHAVGRDGNLVALFSWWRAHPTE